MRRGHSPRGRSPPAAGWPAHAYLSSPLSGGGAPDWPPLPPGMPPFGMMNPAMHHQMIAAMHQAAAAAAAELERDRRRGDDHPGRDRDRPDRDGRDRERERERERAERFSSPSSSDRDRDRAPLSAERRAPLSAERPPRGDRADRERDVPRSSPPPSNGQPPPPPTIKRETDPEMRREKRGREQPELAHSSSRSGPVTPGHRPPSDRTSDRALDRTMPAGASGPDSAERRRSDHSERFSREAPRDQRDPYEHRSAHHRGERDSMQHPPPPPAAAAAADYPSSQDSSLITPSKHDRSRRHRSRSHDRSSADRPRYAHHHPDDRSMADVPVDSPTDAAPSSAHRGHDSSSAHRHHSSSSSARHHSSHSHSVSRHHGSSSGSKHRSSREGEAEATPEKMPAPIPAAAAPLDHKRSRSRSRDTSASRKRARSRSPPQQHQRHPRDYSPPPHFQPAPSPPRGMPADRPSHHAPYPPQHSFHDLMPARHPEPMRHPSDSMRHQQPLSMQQPLPPPPQHEPLSRYPSMRGAAGPTPERPRVEPAPRPSRPDPRAMGGPPDHRLLDRDRPPPPPQDYQRDPYLERQHSEGRFNERHPSSSGMAHMMDDRDRAPPIPPPFAAIRDRSGSQPAYALPMPHVPAAMPERPLDRQSSMEPPSRGDPIDLTSDRRRSSHPHRPADLNLHASASNSNALPSVMSPPFSRAVSEPHPQSQAQFDRMHGTPRGPTPPQNERSISATSVQTPHTPSTAPRPAFPAGASASGSGSSRAGAPPSTPAFSRSQSLQLPSSSPSLSSSVSATAAPGIYSAASSLSSATPLLLVLGSGLSLPEHGSSSSGGASVSFEVTASKPSLSKEMSEKMSELEKQLMALMTQQRQAQMDVLRAELVSAASTRDLNTALSEITRVEAICK